MDKKNTLYRPEDPTLVEIERFAAQTIIFSLNPPQYQSRHQGCPPLLVLWENVPVGNTGEPINEDFGHLFCRLTFSIRLCLGNYMKLVILKNEP